MRSTEGLSKSTLLRSLLKGLISEMQREDEVLKVRLDMRDIRLDRGANDKEEGDKYEVNLEELMGSEETAADAVAEGLREKELNVVTVEDDEGHADTDNDEVHLRCQSCKRAKAANATHRTSKLVPLQHPNYEISERSYYYYYWYQL